MRASGRRVRESAPLCGVLLAAGLVLAACHPTPPRLSRLAPDDVVLAFGDSLTHGTGATPAQAYPAQLERLIGQRVVNAGVPGETTAQGLERLPGVLDRYAPRLVLLCLGGNDMLQGIDPAQTEAHLRRMVELIRGHGAEVVLIAVPSLNLFAGVPDFYAHIAADDGIPLEGRVFDEVLKDARLKSDTVHANAAGYRRVAESLSELLRAAGAI